LKRSESAPASVPLSSLNNNHLDNVKNLNQVIDNHDKKKQKYHPYLTNNYKLFQDIKTNKNKSSMKALLEELKTRSNSSSYSINMKLSKSDDEKQPLIKKSKKKNKKTNEFIKKLAQMVHFKR
jgi:hypothetical protein